MNFNVYNENDELVNTIVANSLADAERSLPEGWTCEAAAAQPVSSAERKISRLAFLSRFTDAEAVAIDLAGIGATVQAASIRRYVNKVNAAEFIDLDRPDTRSGVQALEAATLIAAGRAAIILDTPITDIERFKS